MNAFERERPRLRRVNTYRGDTLQRIALREMGDASRWSSLIYLNDLEPPYITDEPADAGERVLLSGASILVPDLRQASTTRVASDPAATFGVDVALSQNRIQIVDGDFGTVSGYGNLSQALRNRLDTDLGELLYHPTYGNGARALRGKQGTPENNGLAAVLVRRCVGSDPRVAQTVNFVATLSADTLRTTGTAVAVDGAQLALNHS